MGRGGAFGDVEQREMERITVKIADLGNGECRVLFLLLSFWLDVAMHCVALVGWEWAWALAWGGCGG